MQYLLIWLKNRIAILQKWIKKKELELEKKMLKNWHELLRIEQKKQPDFYHTRRWQRVRYEVLKRDGALCSICSSRSGPWHVDHIKSRAHYPELALEKENLRVLCEACNFGKGVRSE